jgi:GTP-binding protein
LGVVDLGASERFVIADLPGLIEGASEGAGLGHKFLGHAERCAAIIHLIDITSDDPIESYRTIRRELENYDEDFEAKPEIIALTKCDSLEGDMIEFVAGEFETAIGQKPILISSVAQQGLKPLLSSVYQHVLTRRAGEEAARAEKLRQIAIERGEIEDVKGWSP